MAVAAAEAERGLKEKGVKTTTLFLNDLEHLYDVMIGKRGKRIMDSVFLPSSAGRGRGPDLRNRNRRARTGCPQP
jgi:hypothetical protein